IERAYADGVRVFLEHGPQARCTGWIRQILNEREHLAVALDGADAVRQLRQVVAELVASGTPVQAPALFDRLAVAAARPVRPIRTVRLPAHPPQLRLPGSGEPTVLPRAPQLRDVLPSAQSASTPSGYDNGNGVARAVADQFARVTALHQEFLARQ